MKQSHPAPSLEDVLGTNTEAAMPRLQGEGPSGVLPLTEAMLRHEPSGNLFGLTQNAGMGWDPADVGKPQYLIVSTQGGLRAEDGRPVALGFHTGHWEIGLLVRRAAETLREEARSPSPSTAATPATAGPRGRRACSTASPTATTRPSLCAA